MRLLKTSTCVKKFSLYSYKKKKNNNYIFIKFFFLLAFKSRCNFNCLLFNFILWYFIYFIRLCDVPRTRTLKIREICARTRTYMM